MLVTLCIEKRTFVILIEWQLNKLPIRQGRKVTLIKIILKIIISNRWNFSPSKAQKYKKCVLTWKTSIIIPQLSVPVSCSSPISTLRIRCRVKRETGKTSPLIDHELPVCAPSLLKLFCSSCFLMPLSLWGLSLAGSRRDCKWTCWINKLKNVIKYLRWLYFNRTSSYFR